MTVHWLYWPEMPSEPAEVVLDGPEAQHARARRLRPGEGVCLFDGRGLVATADVLRADRRAITLRIRRSQPIPPRKPRLTVAVSCPKADRSDWLLEKLTELGVASIYPLRCRRSTNVPAANRLDRWRRLVIEAAKQAHVAWLPEIHEPRDLPDLLKHLGEFTHIYAADLTADAVPISAAPAAGPDARPLVLIGPEGGFTDEERGQIARCGAVLVSLGATILRSETAAIVAAGVLLCAADAVRRTSREDDQP